MDLGGRVSGSSDGLLHRTTPKLVLGVRGGRGERTGALDGH